MRLFSSGDSKAETRAERARDREHAAWSEEHGPGHAARIARAQREADEARDRADRTLYRGLFGRR